MLLSVVISKIFNFTEQNFDYLPIKTYNVTFKIIVLDVHISSWSIQLFSIRYLFFRTDNSGNLILKSDFMVYDQNNWVMKTPFSSITTGLIVRIMLSFEKVQMLGDNWRMMDSNELFIKTTNIAARFCQTGKITLFSRQ